MLPFCGYNMADYWQHWIDIGATLDPDKAPKIFNVNWFRTDDEGHFIWPGYGDNFRVIKWILGRCKGTVDAAETSIGYMPKPEDIDLDGIEDEVDSATLNDLLSIDKSAWKDEIENQKEFFAGFDRLPDEIKAQQQKLIERLGL